MPNLYDLDEDDPQAHYEDYLADLVGEPLDPTVTATQRDAAAAASSGNWKPNASDNTVPGPAPLPEDSTVLPGGEVRAIDDLDAGSLDELDALLRKANPNVYQRFRAHPEEFSDALGAPRGPVVFGAPRSALPADAFDTRPLDQHRGPAMAQYDLFVNDWAEPRGTDPSLDAEEDRLYDAATREAALKGHTVPSDRYPMPQLEDQVMLPGGENVSIDSLDPDAPDFEAKIAKAWPSVYAYYQRDPEAFREQIRRNRAAQGIGASPGLSYDDEAELDGLLSRSGGAR